MEKDLLSGNVGQVGKYDVAFKDGALAIEVDASISVGSAGLIVKVDAGKVIDAIAAAIPGTVDDAILGLIKAALLGK